MNEFMEQYWSFYNAGVAIFLFAGLALFFKLIFFRRKRHKKEPHLTLSTAIIGLKMILETWKRNFMLCSFCQKMRPNC